jgi:protein-tyrosine-phosphatase
MTAAKPRVLFLCTHNAARSQMAEGILRHLGRGAVDVASAGTEPSHVHPFAVGAKPSHA